ncbi:hypothetical protein F5Y08DRAFT_349936 [Xylaria arbuscula]|nr:hypothetical protein F5Y08DRAFT_349936 [Xylaria arbuscula]
MSQYPQGSQAIQRKRASEESDEPSARPAPALREGSPRSLSSHEQDSFSPDNSTMEVDTASSTSSQGSSETLGRTSETLGRGDDPDVSLHDRTIAWLEPVEQPESPSHRTSTAYPALFAPTMILIVPVGTSTNIPQFLRVVAPQTDNNNQNYNDEYDSTYKGDDEHSGYENRSEFGCGRHHEYGYSDYSDESSYVPSSSDESSTDDLSDDFDSDPDLDSDDDNQPPPPETKIRILDDDRYIADLESGNTPKPQGPQLTAQQQQEALRNRRYEPGFDTPKPRPFPYRRLIDDLYDRMAGDAARKKNSDKERSAEKEPDEEDSSEEESNEEEPAEVEGGNDQP